MTGPPERLHGPTLGLRRLSSRHADELAAAVARSLPELRRFMDWARSDPSVAADFADFLADGDRDWETGAGYGYHIFDAGDDELVGGCGLMRRVGPGAIEIGYWIRSDRAGRGLATEAAALLVEAAWGLDDVDRIVIRHDAANGASGRVAEKLGFHETDRVAVAADGGADSGLEVIREVVRADRRVAGPPLES